MGSVENDPSIEPTSITNVLLSEDGIPLLASDGTYLTY
jgi:hypothetical protein